jgi:hypothetical protein
VSTTVELSFFELWQAAGVGAMRNIQARRRGRPDTYGKDVTGLEGGWGVHIEGAAAEMAVAKALGLYWEGVWSEIDRGRGDVGDYQVRHTLRDKGCLLLHPDDLDDAMFVLVTGVAPKLRIAGKIMGREGKDTRYWRTDTGRPAFFIPQGALTPLHAA